ncbi:hypothetical protein ACG04Q_03245 [Roseateles sp. DXS20W]|uniref:PH domain-containing protein n=1 Tax=Pelomonas lactea TaxID=3299030 RepID=A0ABW7GF85_9BURK
MSTVPPPDDIARPRRAMRGKGAGTAPDRITPQDWALAIIGGLFTLAGLLILRNDFNTGIVTLALFGLCFVHAVGVIVRKRRLQRQQAGAVTASVTGGVPLRQSRARMLLLAGALLAIGATHAAFTTHPVQIGIGWLLLAVGGVMLLGLLSGRLYTGYLQFDPDGLSLGDRHGRAHVPWDAITGIARTDLHTHPLVLVSVDAGAVQALPATHGPRLMKQMGRTHGQFGADFAIMTTAYGIDAPVLLAALRRYATQPAARQELQRPPRLRG